MKCEHCEEQTINPKHYYLYIPYGNSTDLEPSEPVKICRNCGEDMNPNSVWSLQEVKIGK